MKNLVLKDDVLKTVRTKWFLYCEDAASNEAVAATLLGAQSNSDFSLMECGDGERRHLYEVTDYGTAARLWKSQKQLKAKLQIFRSQNDGKPAKWELITKRKITPAKIAATSSTIKMNARMQVHRAHKVVR